MSQECRSPKPVTTMRFLRPSSRGRTLASRAASVAGCFLGSLPQVGSRAVGFAGCGTETASLTPLLLRLELGQAGASLALESGGGMAEAWRRLQTHFERFVSCLTEFAPFGQHLPAFLQPPGPGNHHFTSYFWGMALPILHVSEARHLRNGSTYHHSQKFTGGLCASVLTTLGSEV